MFHTSDWWLHLSSLNATILNFESTKSRAFKLKRTWFKLSFFQNRFFVRIWPFEVSDQKIKFDGMFKMSGRDFEKFWFSAGKTADPQNPGSKSEKSLRYTVSYQLYYLWSAFGVVWNNFDKIFIKFQNLYRAKIVC